ncbi:MAG TPA: type II secretion system F family protein [Gammaproteobacteria bacterium]|nr:type II secretion system F family protein [Gammaproteobacteria bacterium]
MKKPLWLFRESITTEEILHFLNQLNILISAGLSLIKSLDILIQTNHSRTFRSLILSLRRDLETGKEFNRCLQRFPKLFDRFSCQLIYIGEQSGSLDRALQKVCFYKEKSQVLKKQLKQALIYPTLIFLSAFISVLILLLFVIPQFASLFERFPNKIPFPTQALIQLSLGLHQLLPWLGPICLFSLLTLFHFRSSLYLQASYQRQLFQLPMVRKFALKIALAQFSRTLALILSAGLPLAEALMMVAQLSSFDEFRKGILKIHAGIQAGKDLASNLKLNPLFPALLVHLTKVGEESGTLEAMLEKFAELTESDLEQSFQSLSRLLEPLIIAILGVLIGGIVIAMYLPIFRLGTAL